MLLLQRKASAVESDLFDYLEATYLASEPNNRYFPQNVIGKGIHETKNAFHSSIFL